MMRIGITGGIGTGKSTVTKYLRSKGYEVFDADAVSRTAVERGSAGLRQVVALFGEEVLTLDGDLNRAQVATLVFGDAAKRRQLEQIIHTIVWDKAEEFFAQNKEQELVFIDVPLLIECGWHKRVDAVWLVTAAEEVQIARAMARDKATQEQVRARIRAQMPLEEKRKYCTMELNNSTTLVALHEQIEAALLAVLHK